MVWYFSDVCDQRCKKGGSPSTGVVYLRSAGTIGSYLSSMMLFLCFFTLFLGDVCILAIIVLIGALKFNLFALNDHRATFFAKTGYIWASLSKSTVYYMWHIHHSARRQKTFDWCVYGHPIVYMDLVRMLK